MSSVHIPKHEPIDEKVETLYRAILAKLKRVNEEQFPNDIRSIAPATVTAAGEITAAVIRANN